MSLILGGTKWIEEGKMISILIGKEEREIIGKVSNQIGRSAFIREAIRLADSTNGKTDYDEENTKLRDQIQKLEAKIERIQQDWKEEKKALREEKKAELREQKRKSITFLKETAKERGWSGKPEYEKYLEWMDLYFEDLDDMEKRQKKDNQDDRGMYI